MERRQNVTYSADLKFFEAHCWNIERLYPSYLSQHPKRYHHTPVTFMWEFPHPGGGACQIVLVVKLASLYDTKNYAGWGLGPCESPHPGPYAMAKTWNILETSIVFVNRYGQEQNGSTVVL